MKCWLSIYAVNALKQVQAFPQVPIVPTPRKKKPDRDLPRPFEKDAKEHENVSSYCAAMGHGTDPACEVNVPLKELKTEIWAVFEHVRRFLKDDIPAEEKVKQLKSIEEQSVRLRETMEQLKTVWEDVGQGEMDPEMSQRLNAVLDAGDQLDDHVSKLAAKTGELHEHPGSPFDRYVKLKHGADKLVEYINAASKAVQAFETKVHPRGSKWWRFQWEYCFFEALALIDILLLVLLLDFMHHKIQHAIFGDPYHDVPSMYDYTADNGTMFKRWMSVFFGELAVMGIAQGLMELSYRIGIIHAVERLIQFTGVHSPTGDHIRSHLDTISHNLFIAIVIYFFFVLTVVRSTEAKIKHWRKLEANHQSPSLQHSGSGLFAQASVVGVARSKLEFESLRSQCIGRLKSTREVADEVAKYGSLEEVEFWRYMAISVRHTSERLIKVTSLTWFGYAIIFAIYAVLFYFTHVSYSIIGCALSAFFVVVLLLLHLFVARVRENVYSHLGDDENPWGAHWDYCIVKVFQFVLFFLCYLVARTLASPLMWSLYFFYSIIALVGFAAFSFLFAYYICEVITTFGALMAIPPYVRTQDALRLMGHIGNEATNRGIIPELRNER